MSVPVFLADPATCSPSHYASQKLARRAVDERFARAVNPQKIKDGIVLIKLSWASIKEKWRVRVVLEDRVIIIPTINEPLPYFDSLDLSYPMRGQESVLHPHEAFMREIRAVKASQEADRREGA